MRKNMSLAKLALITSAIGMLLIAAIQITMIGNGDYGSRWQNNGHFFTIFLLIGLWSLYALKKESKNTEKNGITFYIKALIACYGIGGMIYILLMLFSFVLFDVDGIEFIASHTFAIIGIVMLLSFPFVLMKLK